MGKRTYCKRLGLINAVSIAENKEIKNALKNNDRKAAIKTLTKIAQDYKTRTKIKKLKVHIHTHDVKAFVRNWKLDKFGDDLSGFRKAILKVKETREPFFEFEIGRVGLTLRAIVPIIENDKYIGSLEFIQSFENIPKSFASKEGNYLLLMNDSLLHIATYLKDAPKVGNYILSSKSDDNGYFQASQKIDFDQLHKDGYLVSDDYFFTYQSIKDISDEEIGIHLLAIPISQLTTSLDNQMNALFMSVAIAVVSFLLVLSVLMLLL
ncbi:MAG: methyl-accepting chemotaxis protein [Sulfurimonas sp.]|jgi:methyl-accepting chemotaxis protein|uniref:cache domain-containing protein n=1 Tax=Sulfurimonas sp. TaxID=2022749 RepID=UPI0039E39A77